MATNPSTGEGVLPPPPPYGSQHLWTWRSIILSFGYIPRSTSIPLQIRANFLSTFSWMPSYFKGRPHPSASHLQSLFPLFMCRGKSSENYLSGHLQISALLPGLQNMPADKASINSVNSLCHARLMQFTIILSLPPFIRSTGTSFPKSKLSFLNFSSPDFWKALSTHDPNQYFKKV